MSDGPQTAAKNWRESLNLGRTFWLLCSMEMWERLAYYGVRVIVPIYIAQADEPGGLHFTQLEKGTIYFWWAIFQSLLPTFTGGYADRYGYKKTISIAITIKIAGYMLMATQRSFNGFLLGCILLATGTAIFKPGIQGTLAHNIDKSRSSTGWGIFYWLVNVGAAIGPPLAGMLRKLTWPSVFYGCAAIVSINYLMLFTYKDPETTADTDTNAWQVMVVTLKNLWDARLLTIIAILSGFWLMMYQLWDLHPNFIADWVDSSAIANSGWFPEAWTHATDRGQQVLQENIINLNAVLIVLTLVPISVLVRRMKTLSAMAIGMLIAIAGIVVSGTNSGYILLVAIALFSLGEMLNGPKKLELFDLIAPPDKKALYLGYVNIPVGVGWALGSKLSGYLYGNFGEKARLSQRYLAEKTDFLQNMGLPAWDGNLDTLEATTFVTRPQAYATLKNYLGKEGTEMTTILWDTYQPQQIWYYIACVGAVSVVALFIFIGYTRKTGGSMNV
jgi:MFS family permease